MDSGRAGWWCRLLSLFPRSCIEELPQTLCTYPWLPGRLPEPSKKDGAVAFAAENWVQVGWDKQRDCEAKEAETRADRSGSRCKGVGMGEGVAQLGRFGPQTRSEDSGISGQCWGHSSPT